MLFTEYRFMKKRVLSIGLIISLALITACGKKGTSVSSASEEGPVSLVSISSSTSGVASVSASASDREEQFEVSKDLKTVTLGSFEQDNNDTNGSEPIEWIILFSDEDKALVISKYVLDCLPFNKGFAESNWENSSVRKALNSDFLNAAFTAEEQARIIETDIPSVEPDAYIEQRTAEIKAEQAAAGTEGENTGILEIEVPGTRDRVFLLSDFEVKKYLTDDPEIEGDEPYAKATEYAKARGVYILTEEEYNLFKYDGKHPKECIGGAWWWLRSNTDKLTRAMDVTSVGEIRENGHESGEGHDGIRPAMWISLK